MIFNQTKHRWEDQDWGEYNGPWTERWHWCCKTFGTPKSDRKTGTWGYEGSCIFFYNEKYVTMYMMRWS